MMLQQRKPRKMLSGARYLVAQKTATKVGQRENTGVVKGQSVVFSNELSIKLNSSNGLNGLIKWPLN